MSAKRKFENMLIRSICKSHLHMNPIKVVNGHVLHFKRVGKRLIKENYPSKLIGIVHI